MGRPSKFDRNKAVELAMNEIWQNGYESCSVKAISEKLGITRSSFYNAFESREALFMEALILYSEKTPDKFLKNIDEKTSKTAIITKLFREVCKFQAHTAKGRGCMALNCMTELVGVNETLGPKLKEMMLNRSAFFISLVEQAQQEGEIDKDKNPKTLGTSLLSTLVGISFLAKTVQDEEQLWLALKEILIGLDVYNDELIN